MSGSRRKVVIELTQHEAETLRLILGNVYVDNLLPNMTAGQRRAEISITRKLHAARHPEQA